MDQQADRLLIKKYLSGTCTPEELQLMDALLDREDTRRLLEEVLSEEWEAFEEQEIPDRQIARWKERFVQERLRGEPHPRREYRSPRSFLSFPYAAVWIAVLLCTGLWFGVDRIRSQREETRVIAMLESANPDGQRSRIRLSDSTMVYLGAGSRLVYPERFTDTVREVSLYGEAFFEVTKNPQKPFIIHTGDVQTRVLGTSFRIDAFAGQPLHVEVATGKVQVERRTETPAPLAVLTPGQRLTWHNAQAVLETVDVQDVSGWKDGRLVFNGSTLKALTGVLERWYGVRMEFTRPATAARRVTITLTANIPLNKIMDILAATGKFTYHIHGKKVTIH